MFSTVPIACKCCDSWPDAFRSVQLHCRAVVPKTKKNIIAKSPSVSWTQIKNVEGFHRILLKNKTVPWLKPYSKNSRIEIPERTAIGVRPVPQSVGRTGESSGRQCSL